MSNPFKNCDNQIMGSEPLRPQFRKRSKVQFGPSWYSLQPSPKEWGWISRQTCFHSFQRCPCSSSDTKKVRTSSCSADSHACSPTMGVFSQTLTEPFKKCIGVRFLPAHVVGSLQSLNSDSKDGTVINGRRLTATNQTFSAISQTVIPSEQDCPRRSTLCPKSGSSRSQITHTLPFPGERSVVPDANAVPSNLEPTNSPGIFLAHFVCCVHQEKCLFSESSTSAAQARVHTCRKTLILYLFICFSYLVSLISLFSHYFSPQGGQLAGRLGPFQHSEWAPLGSIFSVAMVGSPLVPGSPCSWFGLPHGARKFENTQII